LLAFSPSHEVSLTLSRKEFVENVYFPRIKGRLAKSTVKG
jgi:hypothetical protein